MVFNSSVIPRQPDLIPCQSSEARGKVAPAWYWTGRAPKRSWFFSMDQNSQTSASSALACGPALREAPCFPMGHPRRSRAHVANRGRDGKTDRNSRISAGLHSSVRGRDFLPPGDPSGGGLHPGGRPGQALRCTDTITQERGHNPPTLSFGDGPGIQLRSGPDAEAGEGLANAPRLDHAGCSHTRPSHLPRSHTPGAVKPLFAAGPACPLAPLLTPAQPRVNQSIALNQVKTTGRTQKCGRLVLLLAQPGKESSPSGSAREGLGQECPFALHLWSKEREHPSSFSPVWKEERKDVLKESKERIPDLSEAWAQRRQQVSQKRQRCGVGREGRPAGFVRPHGGDEISKEILYLRATYSGPTMWLVDSRSAGLSQSWTAQESRPMREAGSLTAAARPRFQHTPIKSPNVKGSWGSNAQKSVLLPKEKGGLDPWRTAEAALLEEEGERGKETSKISAGGGSDSAWQESTDSLLSAYTRYKREAGNPRVQPDGSGSARGEEEVTPEGQSAETGVGVGELSAPTMTNSSWHLRCSRLPSLFLPQPPPPPATTAVPHSFPPLPLHAGGLKRLKVLFFLGWPSRSPPSSSGCTTPRSGEVSLTRGNREVRRGGADIMHARWPKSNIRQFRSNDEDGTDVSPEGARVRPALQQQQHDEEPAAHDGVDLSAETRPDARGVFNALSNLRPLIKHNAATDKPPTTCRGNSNQKTLAQLGKESAKPNVHTWLSDWRNAGASEQESGGISVLSSSREKQLGISCALRRPLEAPPPTCFLGYHNMSAVAHFFRVEERLDEVGVCRDTLLCHAITCGAELQWLGKLTLMPSAEVQASRLWVLDLRGLVLFLQDITVVKEMNSSLPAPRCPLFQGCVWALLLWPAWGGLGYPLDCKDEQGSISRCSAISLEKLLDRVIQHAELIYRVSEESCTLFEEMFVPFTMHSQKIRGSSSCVTKAFPIPASKSEIQQISDKWLLHSVLMLVQSWMEPLVYLQTTLDRYDDAPDTLLNKTKWVSDKLPSLEQGIVVLIRKIYRCVAQVRLYFKIRNSGGVIRCPARGWGEGLGSRTFSSSSRHGTQDELWPKRAAVARNWESPVAIFRQGQEGEEMLDEGMLTSDYQLTLAHYDVQPEVVESVLRDYALLTCFKKDAHKMETFLKLLNAEPGPVGSPRLALSVSGLGSRLATFNSSPCGTRPGSHEPLYREAGGLFSYKRVAIHKTGQRTALQQIKDKQALNDVSEAAEAALTGHGFRNIPYSIPSVSHSRMAFCPGYDGVPEVQDRLSAEKLCELEPKEVQKERKNPWNQAASGGRIQGTQLQPPETPLGLSAAWGRPLTTSSPRQAGEVLSPASPLLRIPSPQENPSTLARPLRFSPAITTQEPLLSLVTRLILADLSGGQKNTLLENKLTCCRSGVAPHNSVTTSQCTLRAFPSWSTLPGNVNKLRI
ncbi:SOML2 protein, partial [Atractosteus spatula]|nr:SOML2 protein [Atractosteus spatula]